MEENFWMALGLTIFAGLATGVGSILGLFCKKDNKKFLSVALGFSAGVMIYVSFIEIFAKAQRLLNEEMYQSRAYWITVIAFFLGIGIVALIDKFLPETKKIEDIENQDIDEKIKSKKLLRMGIFTALAVGIHNFPEGLATFMSALADPVLGISIAIAIAIHNIPEGLAVSVPIYHATGSKLKAFKYSFLSGLAEPIGALVGYLILMPFLSDTLIGVVFASVAGIMVYISLDELLPAAKEYGKHNLSMFGFICGMIVMALSLLLLQ